MRRVLAECVTVKAASVNYTRRTQRSRVRSYGEELGQNDTHMYTCVSNIIVIPP